MFKVNLDAWCMKDELNIRDIKVFELDIRNKDSEKLSIDNLYKVVDYLEENYFYYIPTEYDVIVEEGYMYVLYDVKYSYGFMKDINDDFKNMKKDLKNFLKSL